MQRANYPVISVEAPHKIVVEYPVAEMFELNKSDHRWRIHTPIVTAPDRESALAILGNFRQDQLR
jgi:hypothetical protein